MRAEDSSSVSFCRSSSSAGSTNEAGSSSVPISQSNSLATARPLLLRERECLPEFGGGPSFQRRELSSHRPLGFQKRKAQTLPGSQVAFGTKTGVVPNPLDQPGAFGHRNRPPSVEDVKGVRTLESVVVGGQRELPLQKALALPFVGIEKLEEH